MKKLMIAAVAVLCSVGAYAQTAPTSFGVKAGVNLPTYHLSDFDGDLGMATNFHVTAYADVPVNAFFSVQPGVSLQGKGAKFDGGGLGEFTQNTMWVEVPVNAVAKLPTMGAGYFYVGAGPYAGFGISGKNKWEGERGSSIEDDFEFGKDGTQKGFDAGVNFLVGYQLGNGVNIGAGYGLGLANIAPDNNADIKQHNRVLSFSVGFQI